MRKILIAILSLIVVGGGVSYIVLSNNDSNETESPLQEEENILKLNNELDGVYAFSKTTNNTLVANIKDKDDVTIIDDASKVLGFDYQYDKLYVYDDREIYSIDLTLGNGKYEKEVLYEATTDSENESILYFYNNKVYYVDDYKSIVCLDLETSSTTTITNSTRINGMAINKENGKLYYAINALDMAFVLYEYDFNKDETSEIFRGSDDDGYYGINLLSLNDNKLIYQVGKDYEFKSYIYDITTKETREYEFSSGGEIFLDDKIYLVKSNNDYTNSGDSIISVDSNNKEETLYGPVSYYLTLQYLGNNTFHFSEIRGQDITAEIIYYNLDIESSEVKEMDYGYSIIKVINDNDLTEPEEINNSKETDITLDDLVGEYEGTRTSDSNYSIGEIFGTSLRYGNSLIINDDNTYSLNVGVAYSEDGKYEIDGNKLKLYDIDNKSDNSRPTEDELLIDVIDDKVTLKHREDIDDNNYVYVIFEK